MSKVFGAVVMTALLAGSANAAQNVANTSQKGSLLAWPQISVEPTPFQHSVVIEISNDANIPVHVECYYINERKARVDFDFHLTGKQTVSWDVYSRIGDQVRPARFPIHNGNPNYASGNQYRGALFCFATDFGRKFQVAHNHLTGTAVVHRGGQAFKYNAWAFMARGAGGIPAPTNAAVSHGRPGVLALTGANVNGVYDACPAYNIANFMPNRASLNGVTVIQNHLAVVSCYQDLRQAYAIRYTKLDFTVWNSFEDSFTGAHYCVDSVTSVKLAEPPITNGSNFDYDVLGTPNARFQVRGVASNPPCPGSLATGLLGVLSSEAWIGAATPAPTANAYIGNTLHGAGALAGQLLWDPADEPPARPQ